MDHRAPYDVLAGEYYDQRHVTSRNFDATTAAATAAWPQRLPSGLVLEPGCGRGRVGQFLGISAERVVQLDNSPAMFDLTDREEARLHVLHDAEALPFHDGEFECVVAFLCDGFLGLNFLAEARRVLKSDGILCGTTPSHEWGTALREILHIDAMSTRFLLQGGGEVLVPSFLYREPQLVEMLQHVGFAGGIEIHAHTVPADVAAISQDIELSAQRLGISPTQLPILYSFWAAV